MDIKVKTRENLSYCAGTANVHTYNAASILSGSATEWLTSTGFEDGFPGAGQVGKVQAQVRYGKGVSQVIVDIAVLDSLEEADAWLRDRLSNPPKQQTTAAAQVTADYIAKWATDKEGTRQLFQRSLARYAKYLDRRSA